MSAWACSRGPWASSKKDGPWRSKGVVASVARGHSVWNAGGGGDDQKSLISNYKPSGVSIWALEYHTLILFLKGTLMK